jgi:hypothetical protein
VQTLQLFKYITHPLASFVPIQPASLPARWKEESYRFKILLFGFFPFGKHSIVISATRDPDAGKYTILDNGFGDVISKWRHLITINTIDENLTAYTDSVEIKAGILTPLVWIYAFIFYHYRQYRWKKLIASGFRYSSAT